LIQLIFQLLQINLKIFTIRHLHLKYIQIIVLFIFLYKIIIYTRLYRRIWNKLNISFFYHFFVWCFLWKVAFYFLLKASLVFIIFVLAFFIQICMILFQIWEILRYISLSFAEKLINGLVLSYIIFDLLGLDIKFI